MRPAVGLLLLLFQATSVLAFGSEHVRVRVEPVSTSIQADSSFDLAVVLDMDPGWHTYWMFSGDAGMATTLTWHLPQGFTADAPGWPGPHRYTEAGDLTVFGYADRTALFSRIRTPAVLPDTVQASVDVSWLVCADICIPGDTTVTWTHASAAPIPSATIDLTSFQQALPEPLTAADGVMWSHRVIALADGIRRVEVTVTPQAGDAVGDDLPDFFPIQPEDWGAYIEAGPRSTVGGSVVSSLELVPYAGADPVVQLPGVLAYAAPDGSPRYRSFVIDLAPAEPEAASIDLLNTDFTGATQSGSFAWFVLLAMLGGLILNLMPCVLPVISIKVLSLVAQSGESATRVRQLGLAFVSGILVTFALLALTVIALQAGGEQLGWGFQFQSPGFVLVLTALVFVLGLSLFGVVTIRLPGVGVSFGGLEDGEGAGSSFLNGVLATILATPCTAPFLGAALGFAFSQSPATIVGIFVAAGLGMALPYLLLAVQPAWVAYLPRPGAWMERFKQGMGFLLMATVVWLLWVLGKQLGMEAVVWNSAFLLCLGLGAWVLGTWVDLRSSPAQRATAWSIVVLLTIGAYALFLHPLLQAPVAAGAPTVDEEWKPFDVDQLQSDIAAGRTVFVDFTAEWCWTCKVNERTVLANHDVRAAFAADNVVLVKADWTSRDPQITTLLRAFGRSGVPLYVVFPGNRPDEPIILPEVITPGLVIDALAQARLAASDRQDNQ